MEEGTQHLASTALPEEITSETEMDLLVPRDKHDLRLCPPTHFSNDIALQPVSFMNR